MVNLDKSYKIKGMMAAGELEWLAEQAKTRSIIVEVGSYHGMSARAMADNTRGILVAIDTWTGPLGLDDKEPMPSFEHVFRANLEDLIESKKVLMHRPSDEELDWISPDMVFIDGDHRYEAVKHDISFWLKRSAPKALICGHDIMADSVSQAVREVFGSGFTYISGTQIWAAYV